MEGHTVHEAIEKVQVGFWPVYIRGAAVFLPTAALTYSVIPLAHRGLFLQAVGLGALPLLVSARPLHYLTSGALSSSSLRLEHLPLGRQLESQRPGRRAGCRTPRPFFQDIPLHSQNAARFRLHTDGLDLLLGLRSN